MLIRSTRFSGAIKVKLLGDQRWSSKYSLAEIYVDDVRDIGKELFLLYPSRAFIRITPGGSEWLIFRFNNYNCEGRVRVALSFKKN